MAVPDLAKAAELSEGEARVIVGLLKKAGWAEVSRGASGPELKLTGGADGLQGVEIKPLLGLFRFDIFGNPRGSSLHLPGTRRRGRRPRR